jgi:ribosomal protein L16 Arg81 hydroxylase
MTKLELAAELITKESLLNNYRDEVTKHERDQQVLKDIVNETKRQLSFAIVDKERFEEQFKEKDKTIKELATIVKRLA